MPTLSTTCGTLNGGSMGGGATYRLGSRYPHLWSSGRPTCGYASYLPMGNLVTLPIYATHSADDPTVSVLHDRGPLALLRELGGQVVYDETDGYGHAVWNYKEGNERGLAWEKSQVRPDSRTVRRVDYTALDGGAVRGWWGGVEPEHYRVIRIKAEIAEVEGTFERERQAILRRIRNDYEGARRRESLLQSAYESMAQAVSAQDAKAIHDDVLKRWVDTDRQLYDTLLQKVKEAGVASALSTSNMNVLDAAEPPMRPYKPSITANILKGIGGGLLCALFLVVSADRINRSLRAPGEAPFHLKVPELGVIPACDGLTRGSFSSSRKSKSTRLLSLNPDDGLGERVELITWQNSNSILAESFRNTLASILLSGEAGRPKVILVTSASREEGKSTTVSNLGIGLAEINHRILLIDADMRKPRLHHIFELRDR